MHLIIIGIIFAIILFPVSLSYGSEWESLLIWNESQPIPVAIVSHFDTEDKKIQIIKQVIESEKQVNQEFFGWNGALSSISEKTNVPVLKLTENTKEAKITIILSPFDGIHGMNGFTTYQLTDEKISKAVVTIHNFNNLKQEQLELVVRHELGHALGLGHTSNSFDLMFPMLNLEHALISIFDLEMLSEMYMKN